MKKIMILLMTVILLIPVTSFASENISDTPSVISANDFSNVLSSVTKSYIQQSNDELFEKTASKIIMVTTNSTNGESIDKYAENIYKIWNVKNIGNNTSVFVLLSTEDMQYWVIVGDNLKNALTSDTVNDILLQYTEPDFAVQNFDAAVKKTYDAFGEWYSKNFRSAHISEQTTSTTPEKSVDIGAILLVVVKVVISVILIFVIAVIIYIFVKREIKLRKIANKRNRM